MVLHCLEKSIGDVVPFLISIINEANFNQEELKNHLEIAAQKFLVNKEKVAWLARNEFMQVMLGKNNAYSWKLTQNNFKDISRTDLLNFFEKFYQNSTVDVYVAGKVTEKLKSIFTKNFSQRNLTKVVVNLSIEPLESATNQNLFEKKNAVQSAIKLGCTTIGRNHKDFATLFMANTILGGYFGSRLMSNIREDKGFTYGIGSGIIHFNQLSYFVISTEVGSDVTQQTLIEVEKEINLLKETLVSDEELQLVKNYILGNLMKGFDGVFNAMTRFQLLNNQNLSYDYYTNLIQEVKQMDAESIQLVAKKYMNYHRLTKIIVGKH